eukprot:9493671-Pyramimonas_sp.AAC.1
MRVKRASARCDGRVSASEPCACTVHVRVRVHSAMVDGPNEIKTTGEYPRGKSCWGEYSVNCKKRYRVDPGVDCVDGSGETPDTPGRYRRYP